MADLYINDIKFAGSELFADSETFLNELSDGEMALIGGGYFAGDGQQAWSTVSNGGCKTVERDEWSTISAGCPRETRPT